MAVSVRDIVEIIENFAPKELASDWDNVGLQVGRPEQPAETILVALDLSMAVLEEALAQNAQMIVVHHPVLFRPLQALHTGEPLVKLLSAAMQAELAVYAAHTNLDAAPWGVSHVLAKTLGLVEVRNLAASELGRIGLLPQPATLGELAKATEAALEARAVRVFGDLTAQIQRVAVCGGSGGDLVVNAVRSGAQVLITGDIGYHDLLEARDRGLLLIDAGHAETETPVVSALAQCITNDAQENGLCVSCLVSRVPSPSWYHLDDKG